MTYARLEDTVPGDVRYDRLAKELGVRRAEAVGLVQTLYARALVDAVDGDLSELEPAEIERFCTWEGTPGALFDALQNKKTQFLLVRRKKIQIENWEKISEGLKRREWKSAERARKAANDVARLSRDCRVDTRDPVAPELSRAELSGADQIRSDQLLRERGGPPFGQQQQQGQPSHARQRAQQLEQQLAATGAEGGASTFAFPSTDGIPFIAHVDDFNTAYRHLDLPDVFPRLIAKMLAGDIRMPTRRQYPNVIYRLLDIEWDRSAADPASNVPPRGALRAVIKGGGAGMTRSARGRRTTVRKIRRGQLELITEGENEA